MSIQTIDTPDATITIETRVSGDGKGQVRTETVVPKANTPAANSQTLADRAVQALAANSTYLAIVSPTNAQVTAQVARLTRECSGLVRLLLSQLDDISGT